MTSTDADWTITQEIGANLPYLRRYARALTGNRETGDVYATATLEAILEDISTYDTTLEPDIALFRAFHLIWSSTGTPVKPTSGSAETGLAARAHAHLARLTPNTREALLLHSVENFSNEAVAQIMGISGDEVRELITIAYQEMAQSSTGNVLIIEDERIIAMDLETIAADMGHRVTGVARTAREALHLADAEPFDLILSDVALADGSNGIDATRRLLASGGRKPIIFITAYPERLLTGKGLEPSFLISKPYDDDQVRSAISQAMFFSSRDAWVA